MFQEYDRFLARKAQQFPRSFDASDLADQFKPYLNSRTRLKVRMSYGEIVTGTVGVTNSWKPVFVLMARSNCVGSSRTLHVDDTIVGIKVGHTYLPLA